MPLSEFYGMARGKVGSAPQKTIPYSTDQTPLRENDFVELVWDNGQIMMQGQSSRRIHTPNNFQSQTMKHRDKDLGNVTNSKTGKFGTLDSAFNDFATAMPSGEMGFSQDDDTVPWWNYPFVDSLQHDYCSELLPELSGVTVNEISAQNSFSSVDKRNSCNQTNRGTTGVSDHNGLSLELVNRSNVSSSEVGESSRSRSGQFFPWSFQESPRPIPSLRSGVSGVISNDTSNAKHDNCGDSIRAQPLADDLSSIKIQKQDSGLPSPSPSSNFLNFSHFSRTAALVRANLQTVGAMGVENKGTAPSSGILAEPMLVDLSNGLRNEMGSHSQPNSVPPKIDSKPEVAKPLEEPHNVRREDSDQNDNLPNQVLGKSKGMPDVEKIIDPVVACSSVGSGNSAERASNDRPHKFKRKNQETDDSEGRSEDVEEESIGVRKAAAAARGGTGSKRSRAAEVHNLSERRRRDRINEKMRALQELIPNCNKVDKASMLDEAIEYLKTLQLQVQIMSMGAGLYMPPMMFPTGMQHMHAAHMAQFSSMAVGMGMGMGMNGGSPGWPMIQVPSMQGPHFSAPHPQPILGPTNFQGMGVSNLQVFGHPGQGQGLAMSSPRPHLMPLSGGPAINLALGRNANGTAATVEVPNTAPTTNSKDLLETTNSQMVRNSDVSSSMNQESSRCQATNEGLEQPTPVAADVGSVEVASLTRENDGVPNSRPVCCD